MTELGPIDYTSRCSSNRYGWVAVGVWDSNACKLEPLLCPVAPPRYSCFWQPRCTSTLYSLIVVPLHLLFPLVAAPLHLHVVPAKASAVQSRVVALPDELMLIAGERRTFHVKACDRFGNACVQGGAEVTAIGHSSLQCAVHDKGDGTYGITWHGTVRGQFSLDLLVNGDSVNGMCVQWPPRRRHCALTFQA